MLHHGKVVCDLPLAPLTEDAPRYVLTWVEPRRASSTSTRRRIPALVGLGGRAC